MRHSLKAFVKSSSLGYLRAGHVLLKDMTGTWNGSESKFKKSTLFGLDGKSYDTAEKAAQKGAGAFYCDTSVLVGPPSRSDAEETDEEA
jgi:N-dimethylarginine dimethylaminohydrolase